MPSPLEQLAALMEPLLPQGIAVETYQLPDHDTRVIKLGTLCYSQYALDGVTEITIGDQPHAGIIMANIGQQLLHQLRDELRRQADAIDLLIMVGTQPPAEPAPEPPAKPVTREQCDICGGGGIDYIGRDCRLCRPPR